MYCGVLQDPAKPYKDKLASQPIEGINRVIGLEKLKKKYGQYSEKLTLLKTYDGFFADDRILPSLSKALGKVWGKALLDSPSVWA